MNFEILPKPPKQRSATTPWPFWPLKLKTSSSHEEGCERDWLIQTKEAVLDENQELKAIKKAELISEMRSKGVVVPADLDRTV